jgi:hypothetical protein
MITSDERALIADLAGPKFAIRADRGWWRLIERDGIVATFEIHSPTGLIVAARADFTMFPGQAPTGLLWNLKDNCPLASAKWPTGGRASQVFNPNWSTAANNWAMYFPYDRQALDGHSSWATQWPGHVWTATSDVSDYLSLTRDVLRSAATAPVPEALAS